MTVPMAMPAPRKEFRLHRLDPRRAVIALSFLLARLSPAHLQLVLRLLSRHAEPADLTTTGHAYRLVVATSPRCAGWWGCLPRSIAVALLCRLRGQWPTWCVGVRNSPPFAAHAWVESEGEIVGETASPSTYTPLVRVGRTAVGEP